MKNMSSMGLIFENGKLLILDQQLLPHQEVWLTCKSPEKMTQYIQALKIRGAPLIGVAAALSLAAFAKNGANLNEIISAAQMLRKARPTAVNLMAAVDRVVLNHVNGDLTVDTIAQRAEAVFDEDVALCDAIGEHGQSLILDGDGILTHCNAGGLATAGIGTALGILRRAHELGRNFHVFVDETRPLLQGARLTAWELGRLGIPYTLICDNMAAMLMRQGRIQKVFVGADRIAKNGDLANKIGTYSVAISAGHHKIPFYVAAPPTTVDRDCPNGKAIPIEQRDPDEVRAKKSPATCDVYNPAFDVTPTELVTAYVLDRGVILRRDWDLQ
jgi:methylthioribose-1-phosphate isomerase